MNENLFDEMLEKIEKESLNMESVIITYNDKEYKKLYTKERLKNIRSLSKTVTSLLLGIAIEKGYFKNGVEEYIMKFFKDVKINNTENLEYLNEIKIKHLITMTSGYEEKILNEKHLETIKGQNLCEFALNYPIKHKAGEYFFYTNAPIYLLSIIIEKETGMKLSTFADKELFKKMNINNSNWIESEQNHSMGCAGLEITPSDLHKIAKLFLNKGANNNEQIVSSKWIEEMSTLKVETPSMYDETRALPKYGYGYNFWICKNGIFYHDGTGGQYIIIVPNKKIVITTTGDQSIMRPITDCMKSLFL